MPLPLVIKVKDVEIIRGCGSSAASRELLALRFVLQKSTIQHVTFKEYAEYTGIPYEDIEEHLKPYYS